MVIKYSVISYLVLASLLNLQAKQVQISWAKAKYASSYQVQIAKDKKFIDIVKEAKKKKTFIRAELSPGIYYIRIAGINKSGTQGPYSDIQLIQVKEKIIEKNLLGEKPIRVIQEIILFANIYDHMLADASQKFVLGVGEKLGLSSSSSDLRNIYYDINNSGFKKYSKKNPIQFFKSSINLINYYAEDMVGNKSAIKFTKIIVDAHPPKVDMVITGKKIKKNNILHIHDSCNFWFNSSDDISGVDEIYVKVNKKKYIPFEHIVIKIFDQDTNTISYYAVDKKGNKSLPKTNQIIIDNTSPKIYFSIQGKCVTNKDSYTISAFTKLKVWANDSLFDNIYVQINTNETTVYNGELNLQEGTSKLIFTAKDLLGNKSEKKITIIKDTTPPLNKIKLN